MARAEFSDRPATVPPVRRGRRAAGSLAGNGYGAAVSSAGPHAGHGPALIVLTGQPVTLRPL
jgi:hypothetical protein